MSLLQNFQNNIKNLIPNPSKSHFLIAVSGGIDSVVLCDLCNKAGFEFSIAHCNFQLRGDESTRDESFVSSLADQYKKSFYLTRFDTKSFATSHKISIQEAARKLRYDWFYDIINGTVDPYISISGAAVDQITPGYIFTAHHLNDNIETVLMNYFKGTGISGLRGILPRTGKLIRPMLQVKRSKIEAYATENKLSWVHDSSNDETKYTRNYFRHTIIPSIEKVIPETVGNLAQNIQRFSEVEILYQQAIELHKNSLLSFKGDEVFIPVLKLQKSIPLNTIIYEIIKVYNFSQKQVAEVLRVINSDTGKYIESSTHRILHNRKWLIISPKRSSDVQFYLIEQGKEQTEFDNNKLLKINSIEGNVLISKDQYTAILDAEQIQYPLMLRKWKQGDYFYPLGMRKKKKLSRFFIDQKISKIDKENVWVIESNKRIIWVVGWRIDDRFKITPATRQAIQLKLEEI